MALIFVDHFIYESTSYDCYFDTGSNTASVNISGPNPHTFIAIPNSGRGYSVGDQISQFCSDNPDTTQVTTFASASTPFFTFTLEAESPSCPTGGGGGGCDIVINSLTVVNETGIGLNDGRATINASSTSGGLQYSINGSVFQSGNVFINLAPGNYTAYAKDAADCLTSQNFSIISYTNPVQNFQDDLPTVIVAPANISKWNAAFNPIVINFQRKDFAVLSVEQQSATQIKVTLNTTLTFNEQLSAINDVIYLKTAKYSYYGKAASYSVVGSNGVLVITEPFTESDTTGYLNINQTKPGYYIEVEVKYGLDPVHPKYIYPQFTPNNKGATRADLMAFLQTLLSFKDDFNYQDISYSDINAAASYQIRFREVWTGASGQWFSAPYPLYVCRAAMQLGERYGGNMAEYVPFQSVASQADRAKWLTEFNQPIYWQGLPFDVSFIYNDDIIGKALKLELTPDCGGGYDGFLLNADASYILDADTGRFVISRSDISSIDVIEALGINRVLIPDVFDCCATEIVARLYYMDGDTRVDVMQPLTIRSKCPCDEPYIYIKWINHLGMWDYYRFGFNQVENANVSNDVMVKRFVANWETDTAIEDIIEKSSIRSIIVGSENLPPDDAKALQWARKSVKVMMLVNANPIKWQTVIIKDGGTDTIQSRRNRSSVQFELMLPSDNIQNQ